MQITMRLCDMLLGFDTLNNRYRIYGDTSMLRNIIILTITLAASLLVAQQDVQVSTELDSTTIRNYAPKLFLDCSWCYSSYLKDEITFVNYVRERTEADVHLLITYHSTSSGGIEYTLEFIGQNDFSDLHYTIKYSSSGTATTDEILLQQRQLETQYSYWSSVGISYTFGSIYSNVVNSRF